MRGGIEFGDIYYNDLDIVGNAFMTAYYLESKIASNSRIILSNNIKSFIDNNIDSVHPVFSDYYLRFIHKDQDDYLIVNPTIILAQTPEIAKTTLEKLKNIIGNIEAENIKSKYDDLLGFIKGQDLSLIERNIFKSSITDNRVDGLD